MSSGPAYWEVNSLTLDSFSVGPNEEFIGYVAPGWGVPVLQLYLKKTPRTTVNVADGFAWYTMELNDIEDLITALEYARLIIIKNTAKGEKS